MSLIKSFNNLLNNNNSTIITHTRNASTSPKRIPLKDQIIQQISTIMSLELNKIDTRDIETKLSIYFNLNENDDASSYIKSLCAQISDIKNSTICKVKNFLNHNINSLIKNSIENNNNFNDNNLNNNGDIDSMRNKFKTILKEVKVLNNNSRVKFKKLYDTLSNEYDKILSTMYDYIQKNNTKLIIDRLNRIEQIKNDILFDVTSVENIQNKFSDTIKNIINKDYLKQKETITKNDFNKTTYNFGRRVTGKNNFRKKNNNNNNNFDNSLNLLNINSYLSQSENDIYNKTFSNGFDISNYNNNNNNNDEIEIIKLYRKKIKEKKNEIEKLKQLLQQEKESKNKAINDLNKLQYSNKMSSTLKNSQKNFSNLEKFNKLTEMIIGFTYSMNNLRNSLYQKTVSHMDAKNIYGKLKMKLISLIEEAYTLKKNLTNNNNNNNNNNNINNNNKNNNFINDTENNDYDEDLNIDENNNNNDNDNDNDNNNNDEHDIKTIKEENENSQILSERASGNIIFNNNNNNNQNNKNGNVVNNNITLTALPNYNIEALIEENKNLRKQLEEKILNYSDNINNNKDNNKDNNNDSTDNKENNNNEIGNNNLEIYQKQISELKKIILQKDQELEEIRNISMKSQKEELNNLIQNNTKNLEQLKSIYQLLIDGKDNRIKELEEEIISYEKEIELLKEENNKLKNECRKDKILSEAEVNNLKNQKIDLQCLLEQGGGSSKTLLNMTNISSIDIADKEKIIKLENEIKIKNKQIIQLTQNHENDLKELNLAIEMLKQKIIQLEEENYNLSMEKNKAIEKNE